MADRKGNDDDRYVVPNKERGGWDVVKKNHERASAHFDTKSSSRGPERYQRDNRAPGRRERFVSRTGGAYLSIATRRSTDANQCAGTPSKRKAFHAS